MNYRKITGKRFVQFSMIIVSLILFWKCENVTKDAELNAESDALQKADIQRAQILDVAKEVEVMPEPEEGLEGFLHYIRENIKYPEEARKQGIEGKVFVRFVVTKNGSISQVEVIKGMGYGLDEEAVRVVSVYQKRWKPGINKGEKVNTEMVLPINYALGTD